MCEKCGGYRHDLPLQDESAENEAAFLAEAAHNYPGCLACEAQTWRAKTSACDGHSLIWWEARLRQWLLWMAVEDIPEGVTLPLGVRYSGSREEAEVAAKLIMGHNPLSLRVVERGADGDPTLPYIAHSHVEGGFELWLPCFTCNGTLIPLTNNSSALAAANEALECFGWLAIGGCPRCRTLSEHDPAVLDKEPVTIWYDTLIHDWVMRMPSGGGGQTSISALHIGHYGASNVEVAAATQRLMLATDTSTP
jgi:hypothetical protein